MTYSAYNDNIMRVRYLLSTVLSTHISMKVGNREVSEWVSSLCSLYSGWSMALRCGSQMEDMPTGQSPHTIHVHVAYCIIILLPTVVLWTLLWLLYNCMTTLRLLWISASNFAIWYIIGFATPHLLHTSQSSYTILCIINFDAFCTKIVATINTCM